MGWFELINEEMDNTGLGWEEFFRDEDSKEIGFNKVAEDGLFLLRDKERVFLAAVLDALEGYSRKG